MKWLTGLTTALILTICSITTALAYKPGDTVGTTGIFLTEESAMLFAQSDQNSNEHARFAIMFAARRGVFIKLPQVSPVVVVDLVKSYVDYKGRESEVWTIKSTSGKTGWVVLLTAVPKEDISA